MSNPYEAHLKLGDTLTGQGKLNDALTQYTEARKKDPSRPEARKQIIALALKKEDFPTVFQEYLDWSGYLHSEGKLDEALKVLQEALSLEGQSERRGILGGRLGGGSRAKDQFNKFAPKLYEKAGEIHYDKKDYDNAISFLDKAVEASSSNTKAYSLLGLSYMAKGQLDKAKGPFQEVVRYQGQEAALAYEKLADIYSSQGNTTQMVIWLKDAAEAYLKREDPGMAVKALERILEVEPNNEDVLKHLGELYGKQGDIQNKVRVTRQLAEIFSQAGLFDKVIVLYENLVECEPDNTEMVNKVIDIYKMSLNVDPGNLRARIKLIENLLRKGATDEVVSEYLLLIENYVRIGLLDEAISCCKSILELEPGNMKARELLADLYARSGKSEEAGQQLVALVGDLREKGEENKAAELIQKAVTLSPEQGDLHLQLAADYMSKGDTEEAFKAFQKVLETDPDDPEALIGMGNILLERRQTDEAQGYFERLAAINPKHIEARTKLVEIYEAGLLREMEEFGSIAV